MHQIVVAVPGCPNVVLLADRLASVLDGRSGVTVARHLITDAQEAASWGMHGSPTVLVNVVDSGRRAWPGRFGDQVIPQPEG